MRKRTRAIVAVLVVAALAAGVSIPAVGWYRQWHPASLGAWVESVRRPGFRLRYRSQTKTHYVAIFEAGPHELAFCARRVDGLSTPDFVVRLTDRPGRDLVDPSRRQAVLKHRPTLARDDWALDDGRLIPVDPKYSGEMRVIFEAADPVPEGQPVSRPPKRRRVIDVHVYWGDRPTAGK